MKIVQSYWSRPINNNGYREMGGWLDSRFHFMSWALSCLKLKEFHKEVQLITDPQGEELLLGALNLPYTSSNSSLEKYTQYPPELWAIGKLDAYRQQKEPFLHVDGDVYIWKELKFEASEFRLGVQSITDFASHKEYEKLKNVLFSKLKNVPSSINDYWKENENIRSINAGVIGGNEIPFIQNYTDIAFEFINANYENLSTLSSHLLNMIFEEHLFLCLAQEKGLKISVLVDDAGQNFENVTRLNMVPELSNYIHLVGYAKKNKYACNQVEARLKYEYPEHHERVVKYLSTTNRMIHQVAEKPNNDYFYSNLILDHLSNKKIITNSQKKVGDIYLIYDSIKHISSHLPEILAKTYEIDRKIIDLKNRIQLNKSHILESLSNVYNFLNGKHKNDILSNKYKLSPYVSFAECDNITSSILDKLQSAKNPALFDFEHKASDLTGETKTLMISAYSLAGELYTTQSFLSGWKTLLPHFAQPLSGHELLDELAKNSDIDTYSIEPMAIDFILKNLIYQPILDLA